MRIAREKISLFFLFIVSLANAQDFERKIYVKANALFLPVGMINIGSEVSLNKNFTLQADLFASPWKSFAGRNAQVYMGNLEGRYYFTEAFDKWYVGINSGLVAFNIDKYNYPRDYFQKGFGFMIGATVGYQLQIHERWNLDFYIGGGSIQSFYHGYENINGTTIRYDNAKRWNKSGEFLPYKGGLMISYKIK